jgi:hypothetical protein
LAALAGAVVLAAVGCQPLAYPGHESATYAGPEHWLCRPDKADDLCRTGDQTATAVQADGSLSTVPFRPARHPSVDCFAIYGTVSQDTTGNSDLDWAPGEEGLAVRADIARFSGACRVFAPVYHQITVPALADGRATSDPSINERAYADVLDAWKEYIAHHNHGRGFILVGHSQGAVHLVRLLREQIEPDPQLRSHFVSAYVSGRPAVGLTGGDVGGDYQSPVCTRFAQTGCVVQWSTYSSTGPPGPFGFFGRDPAPGVPAKCANPAALVDPTAAPDAKRWSTPYIPQEGFGTPPSGPWVDPAFGTVTTPFVTLPRFAEVQCVARNGYHWLEVTEHGDPADPRVDDVGGQIPGLAPELTGIHLMDFDIQFGQLVQLAWIQGLSWSLTH